MNSRTFRAETPLRALLLEQALLLAKQLEGAADAAPDGQVLSRVEALAVPAGRELTRRALEAALQAQAGAAEKKGRRAAPAPAGGPSGTRGTPAATSRPPPATSASNGSTSSAPAAAIAATRWTTARASPASSARTPVSS